MIQKKLPTIDVIMPIYNASVFLPEAISSLQNQTHTKFRVIAIDDGSTDDSAKIYRLLTTGDSRFEIINQENCGVAKTLNNALRLCSAEFIARQDADDISAPLRFEKQLSYLINHPKILAIGSDYQKIINNKLDYIREIPVTSEQISLFMISRNCLPHGGMLFRASIFKEFNNYNDSIETRHVEDFELWERILKIGKIETIPEILYFHRAHPTAVSTLGIDEQNNKAEQISIRIAHHIGRNPILLIKTITNASIQLICNKPSRNRAIFLKNNFKIASKKAKKEKLYLLALGLLFCSSLIKINHLD